MNADLCACAAIPSTILLCKIPMFTLKFHWNYYSPFIKYLRQHFEIEICSFSHSVLREATWAHNDKRSIVAQQPQSLWYAFFLYIYISLSVAHSGRRFSSMQYCRRRRSARARAMKNVHSNQFRPRASYRIIQRARAATARWHALTQWIIDAASYNV